MSLECSCPFCRPARPPETKRHFHLEVLPVAWHGEAMSLRTHVLKAWPACFRAVVEGQKPFELRKNDRGFRAGDRLLLREYVPADDVYTGRSALVEVISVLSGPAFGLIDGFVAMGISIVRVT